MFDVGRSMSDVQLSQCCEKTEFHISSSAGLKSAILKELDIEAQFFETYEVAI